MPDLHGNQQAALDALGWILSLNELDRGQGRSTMQAIALIRHALAHPSVRVPISEFGAPDLGRSRMLAMTVVNLVESDPRLADHFRNDLLLNRVRQPVLCFEFLPGPFPNAATWLPPGWRPVPSRRPPRMVVPDLTEEQLHDLLANSENQITAEVAARLDDFQQRVTARPAPAVTPRPAEPPQPQSFWQHLRDD